MDFSPKLKSPKTNLNGKKILKGLISVWSRIRMLLFFFLLISAVVAGWYIWQKGLYSSAWSEEKKQQYLEEQSKGVIFGEKDFNKALDDINSRKNYDVGQYQSVKDVFAAGR